MRLYEALGERTRAHLEAGFALAGVVETDLLEREVEATAVSKTTDGVVELDLRPFQLVTLRLKR